MEKRKVEKVVNGSVVSKKKSLGKKFVETFIVDDFRSVVSYLMNDVVIPSIKNMVVDSVNKGLEKSLYGEVRSSSSKTSTGKTIFNYNNIVKKGTVERAAASTRDRYDYNDIVLETRAEAQSVVDNLTDLIRDYGNASVADLYDLVGLQTTFTDNKYGWVDVAGISAVRVKDGFLLKLPKAIVID